MKAIGASILSTVLLSTASLSVAGEIDVMTQNQYIGADLNIGTTAPTPEAANQAIIDMLTAIAQSRPAERVHTLATEIVQRHPDVVGLQEAFTFICEGPGCDDPAIKDAFVDHLTHTEEALQGQYVRGGKVTNLQVGPIPFYVQGFGPATLRIEDRDAILVRTGLQTSPVKFATDICPHSANDDTGCNYQSAFTVPLPPPTPSIVIKRGFVAIDVTIHGRDYRVFNTHLEQRQVVPTLCETQIYQVGQAYELLDRALSTWNRWDGLSKRVIVIGDFNSSPNDRIPTPAMCPALPHTVTLPGKPLLPVHTPYHIFTSHGFTDTWILRSLTDKGFTCCQDPTLLNPQSELTERIDMIFSLHRPSQVLDRELLGNTSPTVNGRLWPSDHAALAGTLTFHSPLHPVHIERD